MPQETACGYIKGILRTLILYYITDRTQFPGNEGVRQERLLERVEAAARAGVDYIQLREKDLSAAELEPLAQAVMEQVHKAGTKTRLLINSHFDVATAVGAEGVHLPAGRAVATARKQLGEAVVIGASCHTSAEVLQAKDDGADFAVFGPVFAKRMEKRMLSSGVGIERLQEACAVVKGWPVLALGGVTLENASACLRAGAAGIAGIRLFQGGDVAETVAALRTLSR